MSRAADPFVDSFDRAGRWARAAFLVSALLPPFLVAYVLWLAPVAGLTADRLAIAARDFTALWSAGRLANAGATGTLSDPSLFTEQLRQWFGAGMPDQIWPYPPPILLVAGPLARVPLAWAFPLYTVATLLALWAVLRMARLPRLLCVAVLLSPAIAENALVGQNGALTAALLVGGLLLVDARPVLGGALLGALILKPQLGVLVPACLVARWHGRASLAALAVAGSMAGLSWLCFGTGAWIDYLATTRPAIAGYFQAPWDANGALRMFASVFMAARSLGADIALAYTVQAVVTLSCAVLAFRAWRKPATHPRRRMALVVALTCIASPWVHSYDMPALAVVIAMLASEGRPADRPWLAFAWLWPGALTLVAIPNTLVVLSTASIAWLAWRADGQGARTSTWSRLRCA